MDGGKCRLAVEIHADHNDKLKKFASDTGIPYRIGTNNDTGPGSGAELNCVPKERCPAGCQRRNVGNASSEQRRLSSTFIQPDRKAVTQTPYRNIWRSEFWKAEPQRMSFLIQLVYDVPPKGERGRGALLLAL
ncbi:unnamed protein product [Pleuronectes platessa]|uniref:Uncharacterized protein n=1 Tax=Pleuronectes platessa TaxID=8262 RepID=A0A9N7Z9G1_PLEPL|nr:unnamed protein product [Pleuronectes platessa]